MWVSQRMGYIVSLYHVVVAVVTVAVVVVAGESRRERGGGGMSRAGDRATGQTNNSVE